MKVVESIYDMERVRQNLATPVGFVPTMGYLHEGHITLVKRAKAESSSVVVSIFVNPTQFGPAEDFEKYPRDVKRDLAMLEKAKTDVVFMPSTASMYPPAYHTWVDVAKITERLEGAIRPGHFRGVATVVAKLFNIVEPHKAFFGQKDAQQLLVIKKMVTDLNMNLEVVAVPTVRETDGLAMSSRNVYLNPEQRKQATALYQALSTAQQLWSQGEKNSENIRQQMVAIIKKQPLANIEYISIASADTLEELQTATPPALVSLAVRFGNTRLIDNVVLK